MRKSRTGIVSAALAFALAAGCSEERKRNDAADRDATAASTATPARPDVFPLLLDRGSVYTVSVWRTTPNAHPALRDRLAASALPASATRAVLLSAHDGTALVRIVHWTGLTAAGPHLDEEHSALRPARARLFQVVDSSMAAGAERQFRIGSSVQWSRIFDAATTNGGRSLAYGDRYDLGHGGGRRCAGSSDDRATQVLRRPEHRPAWSLENAGGVRGLRPAEYLWRARLLGALCHQRALDDGRREHPVSGGAAARVPLLIRWRHRSSQRPVVTRPSSLLATA